MATIHHLPQRSDRGSPASTARAGTNSKAQSGEIVIFPGIRYEYWEPEPAVTAGGGDNGSGDVHDGGAKSRRRRS
jgi:hypothetical protein